MTKAKHERSMEFFEVEMDDIFDLYNMKLPDPSVVEFYKNLQNRTIVLNQEFDESLIEVSMYIQRWNVEDIGKSKEERKPIRIFINTLGGDLNSTMNLVDVIDASTTPVYTIGLGRVYSAGGLLLMAGAKRFVFNNTSCLIHDGSTGTFGDTGKVLDSAQFTQGTENRLREYILSRTNIDAETYDKMYRRDWYMFADEMIKYGVADCIIENLDELL